MKNGRKGTVKVNHLTVLVKDEPDVPDWLERIAKMNGAAEQIRMGVRALKEAAENTRWEVDALDIATQIEDLVNGGHAGNCIEDLVEDITVMEEVRICRRSK